MISDFFKRGIYGIIGGTVIAILYFLSYLIIEGDTTFTLNGIQTLTYFLVFVGYLFVVCSSSILFDQEKVNIFIKVFTHFCLTYYGFVKLIKYTGIIGDTLFNQALILSIFAISYCCFVFSCIYSNKKYVDAINLKLNDIKK